MSQEKKAVSIQIESIYSVFSETIVKIRSTTSSIVKLVVSISMASAALPVTALQQRTFSLVPGLAFEVDETLHSGSGAPGPSTVIWEFPPPWVPEARETSGATIVYLPRLVRVTVTAPEEV